MVNDKLKTETMISVGAYDGGELIEPPIKPRKGTGNAKNDCLRLRI